MEMSLKNFSFFAILQWLILAFFKVYFYQNLVFGTETIQNLVFYAIVAVLSVALVRRFGVLNYLEAIFAIFCWVVGNLILDALILTRYTGNGLFAQSWYWISALVLGLSVMIFHKKRHIQVRHEQHAHHHGKHH